MLNAVGQKAGILRHVGRINRVERAFVRPKIRCHLGGGIPISRNGGEATGPRRMVPAALPARSEPNGVNVVVLSVAKSDADCANAFFFAPPTPACWCRRAN